jgi:beta-glucosidase/6-phospho-beta-glucosidase/beta-galactosidase
MARTSGETKSYPRISAPGELSESTLAFLRRRAPERCVVFASWERLEPEEGKYDETALEALRQELMTVGSLGAEPVLSLYRGEDPAWFSDRDGWVMEDDLRCFLRYVGKTVRSVGHLASEYITFYEPNAIAWGEPGRRQAPHTAVLTMSYMACAHIRAYRLIKDTRMGRSLGETSVGLVMRLWPEGELRRDILRSKAPAGVSGYQRLPLLAMARGEFKVPMRNMLRAQKGTWADFIGVTGPEDAAGRAGCCAWAERLTDTEGRIMEE